MPDKVSCPSDYPVFVRMASATRHSSRAPTPRLCFRKTPGARALAVRGPERPGPFVVCVERSESARAVVRSAIQGGRCARRPEPLPAHSERTRIGGSGPAPRVASSARVRSPPSGFGVTAAASLESSLFAPAGTRQSVRGPTQRAAPFEREPRAAPLQSVQLERPGLGSRRAIIRAHDSAGIKLFSRPNNRVRHQALLAFEPATDGLGV